MADRRDRRIVAGVVLIVVGAGMLVLQVFEGIGEGGWLLFVGVLLIAGYLYKRAYGLLVAGGIVAGIGLGQVGERVFATGAGMGSIGLGLGFAAIYVIDRIYRGPTAWWPLIPGGILLVSGLSSLGGPFVGVTDYVWPTLLIVLGLALVFGVSRGRERS